MQVTYRLAASPADVETRARAIAVEQSIEMPPHAVRNTRVSDCVLGQVTDIQPDRPGHFQVTIALASETTGFEAGQLMNMLFGNSSLHPDVELLDIEISASTAGRFGGPRFGIEGLRRLTGAHGRAMTCTALKPQGSTISELASLARSFAHAGIDLIKDDHGLADQHSAPFAERVAAIQHAVAEANARTGHRTLYAPSLTGGPARQLAQLEAARGAGVGAILLAPMVSGMGALQELTEQGLPILAHPALAGAGQIAPPLLLGKLFRLAGADAVIYPNHGGRFSFSPELCRAVADTARHPWHTLAPAMPVPAGGIQPSRIDELLAFYGNDVMLLIGGALLEADDIETAAREFVNRVKAQAEESRP